jgi:hypothetical protein
VRSEVAGTASPLIPPEVLQADLAALEAEAMGWLPLASAEGEQGYLHLGDPLVLCRSLYPDEEVDIDVVGVADAGMANLNVLLL